MNKSPCKGCLRRTVRPNCHATCDAYADFVNEQNRVRDERKRNSIIVDYIKNAQRTKRR